MEDEDDFLASIGAGVEDEDAALAGMGVAVDPDGDLPGTAELPSDMRETGQRTRVTQLPAFRMAAGGGMVQDEGPAEVYEERTIEKAPSAHNVAPGTQVGPDLRTSAQQLEGFQRDTLAGMTGRSPITAATIRRAAEVLRNSDANTATGQSFETLGNALGTLMPTAPMPLGMESQPDRRPQAVWRGVGQAALLGMADEAGAALGGVTRPWLGERGGSDVLHAQPPATYETRRDALRQEMAQSEAQAPEGHALGQLMGSAPMALLPGGQATAAGRVGATAGFGAAAGGLRGAGESEAETPGGVALDAATGAGIEGAAAGLMGGAGEVVGPALRWAGNTARDAAIPSRLEASGIWGGQAMRAAAERPGGQAQLATDLRRLDIGHNAAGPGNRRLFPRPERSLDDAAEVRDVAGTRMAEVVREMDAAVSGPGGLRDSTSQGMVDLGEVASEMEAIAREYDGIPVGGADVARTLRERIVGPLRSAGRVSFSEAHRQRQVIDDMIRSWSGEPNLTTAAGRLRTARRGVARAMESAAERVAPELRDQWRQANRDFSVSRFVQERGRGAERLSVQGGMGGATGSGVGMAINGVLPGALGGVAVREAAQQQRMIWPGVRTAGLEAVAETLGALNTPAGRRYAAVLERARNGVGLPAAHFLLMRTRPDYRQMFDESNVDSGEQPQEQQP